MNTTKFNINPAITSILTGLVLQILQTILTLLENNTAIISVKSITVAVIGAVIAYITSHYWKGQPSPNQIQSTTITTVDTTPKEVVNNVNSK